MQRERDALFAAKNVVQNERFALIELCERMLQNAKRLRDAQFDTDDCDASTKIRLLTANELLGASTEVALRADKALADLERRVSAAIAARGLEQYMRSRNSAECTNYECNCECHVTAALVEYGAAIMARQSSERPVMLLRGDDDVAACVARAHF